MEGNAISAAFTALWRGLDHDQLSANIAMEILNQQQLDVMYVAKFAPALQALVKARGEAVDVGLLKVLDINANNDDTIKAIFPRKSDLIFESFLIDRNNEEENDDGSNNKKQQWKNRWEYILKNNKNEKDNNNNNNNNDNNNNNNNTIQNQGYDNYNLPILISLGSGFDVRCQKDLFCNKCNFLRIDRECVQEKCKYIFVETFKCKNLNCNFIHGDVSGKPTFKKIRSLLIEYINNNLKNNVNNVKIIWLAEGLFEYLKSKQQKTTISLIVSLTKELMYHFQPQQQQQQMQNINNKDDGDDDNNNNNKNNNNYTTNKNLKIQSHLIIPFLGESIDRPMKEHYGARFGWKFSNLLTLKAILKNNGWVDDNHGKEDDEIFKWGNLLQFHHILEI